MAETACSLFIKGAVWRARSLVKDKWLLLRARTRPNRFDTLTTWLIPETLDWRIVTASPIEGFMLDLLLATAEARKARDEKEVSCCWPTREITLENILL